MTKTAVVTGSAGFVGQYVVRELRAREYDVVLEIDLAQDQDALHFFRSSRTRFDLAVHCAATVGGRATIDGSPLAVATNLALDSYFFDWLLRSGTPQAVYFSSSAVYPTHLQVGPCHLEEVDVLDFVMRSDQTYGMCKWVGERLSEQVRREGVQVVVPRPFSGTGPGQSLDYPFPSIVARALRREETIEIWSDTVRDFVHISDIVGATFAALDAGIDRPFNICSGVPTSFTSLAWKIAEKVGYSPKVKVLQDKPTGVFYRVGDPSFLNTFYQPKVDLDQLISDMVEHGNQEASWISGSY